GLEAVSRDVIDILAGSKPAERDRRVQIVEQLHPRAGVEYQVRCGPGVRTIGSHDGAICVSNRAPGCGKDLFPALVEDHIEVVCLTKIAIGRVVGDVALEELDPVSLARQGAAQSPPDGSVSIPPRRSNGEPEYD